MEGVIDSSLDISPTVLTICKSIIVGMSAILFKVDFLENLLW